MIEQKINILKEGLRNAEEQKIIFPSPLARSIFRDYLIAGTLLKLENNKEITEEEFCIIKGFDINMEEDIIQIYRVRNGLPAEEGSVFLDMQELYDVDMSKFPWE